MEAASLVKKHCVPCEGGALPFTHKQTEEYLPKIKSAWSVVEDNKKLRRELSFKDFKAAMELVNKIAVIAEEEGHHPDITINYNKVLIELTTHAIGGLSENDFILAAKIDAVEHGT
jgi:4a-hydroxytetrahydrobiopterin dehydratase